MSFLVRRSSDLQLMLGTIATSDVNEEFKVNPIAKPEHHDFQSSLVLPEKRRSAVTPFESAAAERAADDSHGKKLAAVRSADARLKSRVEGMGLHRRPSRTARRKAELAVKKMDQTHWVSSHQADKIELMPLEQRRMLRELFDMIDVSATNLVPGSTAAPS